MEHTHIVSYKVFMKLDTSDFYIHPRRLIRIRDLTFRLYKRTALDKAP